MDKPYNSDSEMSIDPDEALGPRDHDEHEHLLDITEEQDVSIDLLGQLPFYLNSPATDRSTAPDEAIAGPSGMCNKRRLTQHIEQQKKTRVTNPPLPLYHQYQRYRVPDISSHHQ